jgi:NAD(P)-dependent dehydrogenase (short-subunit alcohol dehydrogenase family)
MGLLDDQVVLVSGVGPGLGRSTAAAALREGASVVLGDLDGERVEAIRAELDPGGERSVALRMDLTVDDDCTAIAAAAAERFGRLDGVAHVAALDTVVGGLMDGALDDWDRTAAVNVAGTLRLTKACVPLLRVRGGSVVVVNTIGAFRPRAGSLRMAYGVSKGALITAAKYLATELGADKIRVNTVSPGWKWGPVLESYARGEAERLGTTVEQITEPWRRELALGEMADDDDIANAIVFFLSPLAARVTGQMLMVDGGGYYP